MKEKRSHGSFVDGHDEAIGRNDTAGMPREVVMKEYPRSRMLRGGKLDDSITGIDDVISHSEGKADKYISNQK
jgi:hypothetical protein